MPERLTFIHAADLHLGAPFRGVRALSKEWAQRLITSLAEAYDRVIAAAISRNVDFVVLSGDSFDLATPSYGDYARFFAGLERLQEVGIPVYLVTGNHDPYTSWRRDFGKLPDNVTMLPSDRPGFVLHSREGRANCIVAGRGYYNQTWPADICIAEGLTRADAEKALIDKHPHIVDTPFTVGVLHCGLNLDRTKAPVPPSMLTAAGMDYWALGHIHDRYSYPSFDDPRIVYSGCIQGRDMKETGSRGVFCVTLEKDIPNKIEFIPTASIVWQRLPVDISHCLTLPAVIHKIMQELYRVNGNAQCEEMIVRITLKGATALHSVLKRKDVQDDLRLQINDSCPGFFCDTLLSETVAPRDKDALRREGLFPSVFLRVADRQKEEKEAAIDYVQSELLARGVQIPAEIVSDIDTLLDQAENLVLDLLGQGENQ